MNANFGCCFFQITWRHKTWLSIQVVITFFVCTAYLICGNGLRILYVIIVFAVFKFHKNNNHIKKNLYKKPWRKWWKTTVHNYYHFVYFIVFNCIIVQCFNSQVFALITKWQINSTFQFRFGRLIISSHPSSY